MKVTIKVRNNEEAREHTSQLKRYGYKKTSDCYWFETWEKEDCANKVIIERV